MILINICLVVIHYYHERDPIHTMKIKMTSLSKSVHQKSRSVAAPVLLLFHLFKEKNTKIMLMKTKEYGTTQTMALVQYNWNKKKRCNTSIDLENFLSLSRSI